MDSHRGGRGFGSLAVAEATAECSSSYERLYYCYYKHVNGCIYITCSMVGHHPSSPSAPFIPLHFLIFSFCCVIMNLISPSLVLVSWLYRPPPPPPARVCSVSSSPRWGCAFWQYGTPLKLHANRRQTEHEVDQFQKCLATFYYCS